VRLARKNDDPVLLRDLERLAGGSAGGDVAVLDRPGTGPEEEAAAAAARNQDLEQAKAALAAFKRPPLPPQVEALGPFEQRFVRGVVHVRRFLPFYAGAGLWLFAMLLIQPLGGGGGAASADLAGAVGNRPAARAATSSATAPAATATVDAAPVFDDFGGSSLAGSSFDFSSSSSSFASSFDDDTSSSSSSSSSPTTDFDTPATFGDVEGGSSSATEEKKVAIVASGYASRTGGTPLEQDPADGSLPVHAAAGQAQKLSFVRLEGDDTTLRLKVLEGGVNAETAAVRACVVTAAWQPARGVAMSAAPAFDATRCAVAKPGSTGVLEFDLAPFGVAGDGFGYVLTVAADVVPPPTFQIAFDGVPATAGG
jgi:hypothetical protein